MTFDSAIAQTFTDGSTSWLEQIIQPEPWVASALCAQTDPEIFHPEKGGSTRDAKAVCSRCEVVLECRAFAFRTEQTHGIWGGLSAQERRRMRRAS